MTTNFPVSDANTQAALGSLVTSDQFNLHLANNGVVVPMKTNGLRQMVNVARYTEDLTWAYAALSGATLATTPATVNMPFDGRLMTLTGILPSSFNASLQHRYGPASMVPFVAGQKYLVSYYAYAPKDTYFYMRPIASTAAQGHAIRGVRAGRFKRVWALFSAISQSTIDPGITAEVALGSGSGVNPQFYQSGLPGTAPLYVGGFQIEAVAPTTKNGIMIIGDSTVAGSSGKIDACYDFTNPENCQWSTHLAVALNCACYNRGVGGETLTSMLARWDTDMTPLAPNSQYCIIQGGINDIGQSHTLAQMQSDLQGMVAKAIANGFTMNGLTGTIRLLTVSPTGTISTGAGMEAQRKAYNAWLVQQYGAAALDIASVLTNPWDPTTSTLHPAYIGADTTHPVGIGREAVANYIAVNGNFNLLPQPSAYQRQQS